MCGEDHRKSEDGKSSWGSIGDVFSLSNTGIGAGIFIRPSLAGALSEVL